VNPAMGTLTYTSVHCYADRF